ncbi:hypothetical protein LSAT2_014522 [Lamellibrachia satsuma]|nr:hypothetical protein LSAT2_014522 [Lamellibrachia satsuma]
MPWRMARGGPEDAVTKGMSHREVEAAVMSEAQIREAFDACDADKSGKINCSELVKVLQAIGYADKAEESATAIIKEVDTNADGQISFDEFKAALAKCPK